MVVTPMESIDGVTWVAIPGVTVQTLTPTSLTAPVGAHFTINSSGMAIRKSANYYGIKFVGNASSTMAVQAWYNFQRDNYLTW